MEEGSKSGLSDLIEACKRSERSAQRRLYDFLSPKMFPLCLRYMGDRDSAEDVATLDINTLRHNIMRSYLEVSEWLGDAALQYGS